MGAPLSEAAKAVPGGRIQISAPMPRALLVILEDAVRQPDKGEDQVTGTAISKVLSKMDDKKELEGGSNGTSRALRS